MKPIVEVRDLSKLYRLGAIGATSLREALGRWLGPSPSAPQQLPTEATQRAGPEAGTFWALRDVSFDVERGEVVGIIGRNGAGKSTLLKILSRITEPTAGRAVLRGRVVSLLEIGTGFHPELSGRENIFLNGVILGMKRAEIAAKFDEIVDFAEIGSFIDTPVKRYSSGMYVRLAFAVAAHLEPEILIVDEVLAVGDAEFQKKCLGKMQDVSRGGRTVLFVSHNVSAIRALCGSAIVLNQGRIQYIGNVSDAVGSYMTHLTSASAAWQRAANAERPPLGFEEIRVVLEGEQPRMVLKCEVLLRGSRPYPPAFVAIDILDRSLTTIMQVLPVTEPFLNPSPGDHVLKIEVELPPLVPGSYLADFWVGSHFSSTLDYVRQAVSFEIVASPTRDRSFPHSFDHGFLVPVSRYEYQAPEQAVASLSR